MQDDILVFLSVENQQSRSPKKVVDYQSTQVWDLRGFTSLLIISENAFASPR